METENTKKGGHMAELKELNIDVNCIPVDMSIIDLFIITQAIAKQLAAPGEAVPLTGALRRIGIHCYNTIIDSGLEPPADIKAVWIKAGICRHPENDQTTRVD